MTDAGLGVLLNFHYSDFWADPGKQIKPKAWKDYSVEQLEQAVYDFTVDTMKVLKRMELIPRWCRLETSFLTVCYGRREKCQITITLQNLSMQGSEVSVQWTKMYRSCFILTMAVTMRFTVNGLTSLQSAVRDFQIIGLSYYPFWHGTLDMLTDNMNDIAERYGKDLIVAEVSMGYTMEDYKDYEKLSDEERKGYATKQELVEKIEYPMTVQGQYDFMEDFLNRISHIKGNRGKDFSTGSLHGSWFRVPAGQPRHP